MSVLEEVLEEEFERSIRVGHAIRRELDNFPKGSVRVRKNGDRDYYYLNYREGNKARSRYIPAKDVELIKRQVTRRKELLAALKEQEQACRQIERALGRRLHVE